MFTEQKRDEAEGSELAVEKKEERGGIDKVSVGVVGDVSHGGDRSLKLEESDADLRMELGEQGDSTVVRRVSLNRDADSLPGGSVLQTGTGPRCGGDWTAAEEWLCK